MSQPPRPLPDSGRPEITHQRPALSLGGKEVRISTGAGTFVALELVELFGLDRERAEVFRMSPTTAAELGRRLLDAADRLHRSPEKSPD